MTLEETVIELRSHLENWYNSRKTVRDEKGHIKSIWPNELANAKDEFMTRNPDCKEHEFNIYYDFVAKEKTYKPGCICGDCDILAHVKSTGIIVKEVDWKEVVKNAGICSS